jgi:hypothetical protein
MKNTRIAAAAILLIGLFSVTAHAQEELVLYDNFKPNFIDQDQWVGFDAQDPGINILDLSRTIDKGRLHMVKRSYGRIVPNILDGQFGSEATGSLILPIPVGFKVTAIEATLQMNQVVTIGCVGNSYPSSAFPRVQGYFFNTQPPSPPPSPPYPPNYGAMNEVMAQIGIYEDSLSSIDEENHHHQGKMLDVVAYVIHCGDPTCSNVSQSTWTATLETIRLGEKRRLRIVWDQENGSFIFTSSPPHCETEAKSATIYYGTLAVHSSATNAHKRLSIRHAIPNCTIEPEEPRPLAYTDVYFDNVYVNESALP